MNEKTIFIPKVLYNQISNSDIRLTGTCIVLTAIDEKGDRYNFDGALPLVIHNENVQQIMILISMYNHKDLFTLDDFVDVCNVIGLSFEDQNQQLDYYLENDNNFIELISFMVSMIMDNFKNIGEEELQTLMKIDPNIEYCRFDNAIKLIYTITMRAISYMIFNSGSKQMALVNDYMFPINQLHLLYDNEEAKANASKFSKVDAFIGGENCLFNQYLIHHQFINLLLFFDSIIVEFVYEEKDNEFSSISKFKDFWKDYPYDDIPEKRLNYAYRKLIGEENKLIDDLLSTSDKFIRDVFRCQAN